MSASPWPDGKRAAVVFNIAYEAWDEDVSPGVSIMGNPLPAGVPDTQAIEWAEYGWRRGIWRLISCLARYHVRATVMASARLAELAPDSLRALSDAGHDVCGHSYAQNIVPVTLTEDEERAHIQQCKKLLADFVGTPAGWISPRLTPSRNTRRLLAEAGFTWHGDCFDHDFPYVDSVGGRRIVAIPMTMEVNDLPVHIRHGNPPRALVDIFSDAFAAALAFDDVGHVDVTVHPHVFGRPYGVRILDEIVQQVLSRDDVWVTTKTELAQWALTREVPES